MAIVFDDRTGHDEPRPARSGRPAVGQRRHGSTPPTARTATAKAAPPRRRPDAPPARRPQLDGTPIGEVLPPRPLRLRPPRPRPAATDAPAARRAAPKVRRVTPMRTRTHGGVARRPGAVRTTVWHRHHDEPMVRLTAGVVAGPPPPLVVVPRRRRVSRFVAVGFAVVFVLMMAAAAFQTQLAGRQVELDKVDRSIRDANQQYNDLRRQRSELRAPQRLAEAATALGMRPATSTEFVSIDPQIIALVQQAAGGVFDPNASTLDALDEFSRVKSIAGPTP